LILSKEWLGSLFRFEIILSLWILSSFGVKSDTSLPICTQRSAHLLQPWVDSRIFCIERVIHDASGGELGFTALAVAPNGVLYATRPYAGKIFEITDTDGDRLPDTARVLVDDLTLPNGLVYYDGALYISGDANIYRFQDGELEILVGDLPSGEGFWTGGLTIGPDERIYVATGASCDFCVSGDEERGAIFSFALDGSDRQLVATGLRYPADLAFHLGALWTVDNVPKDIQLDVGVLNRVLSRGYFGWPYYVGQENRLDLDTTSVDCSEVQIPAFSFPSQSLPLGIASYSSDTFPTLRDTLLVVLAGVREDVNVTGYRLVAVRFDDQANPISTYDVVPNADKFRGGTNLRQVNYSGFGFWPHRPIDVAVSPEGWIYMSVGDGQIFALRPV
jgi:glucose/arabinose dehydrogenase